jgi:hypothetical protein
MALHGVALKCIHCCGLQASVKEREGDHLAAISLYLKGGLPARAAQVRLHAVQALYGTAAIVRAHKLLLMFWLVECQHW